jgi:hypothetical protein
MREILANPWLWLLVVLSLFALAHYIQRMPLGGRPPMASQLSAMGGRSRVIVTLIPPGDQMPQAMVDGVAMAQ